MWRELQEPVRERSQRAPVSDPVPTTGDGRVCHRHLLGRWAAGDALGN